MHICVFVWPADWIIYIYTYFYNIPIFVILKIWCFIPSHFSIRHSAASVALHGRQHEALHDGRHRGTSQDQFRKVGARSVLQLDRLAKNPEIFRFFNLKSWNIVKKNKTKCWCWSKCGSLIRVLKERNQDEPGNFWGGGPISKWVRTIV